MTFVPTTQGAGSARLPAGGGLRTCLGVGLVTLLVSLLLARFLTAGPDVTAVATERAGLPGLQQLVRDNPRDPEALRRLGTAYLTEARATGDASLYEKADEALGRSLAIAPDNAATLVASGLLDTARHHFADALTTAQRALVIAPESVDALGVVADAQIELGRYDEARATIAQMLDARPDIASLSRASYLAQLTGDSDGALVAMEQAAAAGSGSPADVAYVRTLLGDLRLAAGAFEPARRAYTAARDAVASYPLADVGLARVDAATGRLDAAAARLDDVVLRLPLPEIAALHGDVLTRLGQPAQAEQQYELVRAQERLQAAGGVSVDLEAAKFAADRGEPRAVALAIASRATRPTIQADDVLAWALHRTGRSAEALPHAITATRLGTADATLWYHRAAIEAAVGRTIAARVSLTRAFGISPHVSVLDDPAAAALATRLGVTR